MRLVVIGGDAAGMSAAAVARRRVPISDLEIVAFERGLYTSYSACGLPYLVADVVKDPGELIARSPEEHRAQGIDMRTRHEVVTIDTAQRVVRVRDLVLDTEADEPFDQLIIATGATPKRPLIPGVEARGVHGIQTMGDGLSLRAHVADEARDHKRAVVVGGGYIGLELAEAMKARGLEVTVVERGSQPLHALDADMGALVAEAMRGLGIDLRTGTAVEAFETDISGHVRAVVTTDGTIDTDLVVLGLGVKPNVALARDAGIAIGEKTGAIAVDECMATSVEGIWAAGDCVESHHRVTGERVVVPLGTHANKQGRVVGINATGGDARFPGVIGTAVTKICEYEIGRTGCNEREATAAGIDYVTATVESTSRARYFPGVHAVTVKVLAERGSGRLIGAQIVGREGAAKRVDVLATAIWAEFTVSDLEQLDLGYAPPFSPVWDAALVAARKAGELL